MPAKPAAEIVIDAELVRRLVIEQAAAVIPDVAALALEKAAEGWDAEMWRLGPRYAVRLPRRAASAALMEHEHRALPGIAARLAPLGIAVPDPVVQGRPTTEYPWRWSVVPWIAGEQALAVPRARRTAWADDLAAALRLLHTPAPDGFPVNPVRGVPLARRDDALRERLTMLRRAESLGTATLSALEQAWERGLTASGWAGSPVWIHGDLHPGNLIVRDDALAAIIDFGDVTAGDPAYDLAVAWLAFDREGRARFRRALAGRYDDSTWLRARAWAAAIALMLLAHSDDEPAYAALGREAAAEVVAQSPA